MIPESEKKYYLHRPPEEKYLTIRVILGWLFIAGIITILVFGFTKWGWECNFDPCKGLYGQDLWECQQEYDYDPSWGDPR